jgi:hypothetical protein
MQHPAACFEEEGAFKPPDVMVAIGLPIRDKTVLKLVDFG